MSIKQPHDESLIIEKLIDIIILSYLPPLTKISEVYTTYDCTLKNFNYYMILKFEISASSFEICSCNLLYLYKVHKHFHSIYYPKINMNMDEDNSLGETEPQEPDDDEEYGHLNEPQPAEDARMEESQRIRRDNDNHDDEGVDKGAARQRCILVPLENQLRYSRLITRTMEASVNDLTGDGIFQNNVNLNRHFINAQLLRIITPTRDMKAQLYAIRS